MASQEQFATLAQTTIGSSYTAGATSLVLSSATGFPTTGNWRLTVLDPTNGTEVFKVTAVSGTTLTVVGAQEGTSAANHSSGTPCAATITAAALMAAFPAMPSTPQGRLSVTSNTPRLVADAVAQGTIYYCADQGAWVPVFDGVSWDDINIGTQLSLALDSNAAHTGFHSSTHLYDVFVTLISGVPTLVTGPAWTNSTTRASAVSLLDGIWTNTSSMTAKNDTTSGNVTVAANQGTLVGTMYATANGQTGVAFKPAAASGGTNNIIGITNIYNRQRIAAISRDSAASYTYATGTFRQENNSASNRISWIDSLGQIGVKGHNQKVGAGATATGEFQIGMLLNATSGTPSVASYMVSSTATLADNHKTATCVESFLAVQGFNFIQSMEGATAATTTFNTVTGVQALTVDLEY